ncbi:MAG: hypothetical protein ABID54_00405 [Pseudomonadota bacterium]
MRPIQPVFTDDEGIARFKENAIVRFLLNAGSYDLNQIVNMPFSDEDREQFAMLIGYSLSGFSELPYVSEEVYERAEKQLENAKSDVIIKTDFSKQGAKDIKRITKEYLESEEGKKQVCLIVQKEANRQWVKNRPFIG